MALYVLRAIENDEVPYDSYDGFVIRGTSPHDVRETACAKTKDTRWLNPKRTSCNRIDGNSRGGRIILESYVAG